MKVNADVLTRKADANGFDCYTYIVVYFLKN